MPCSYRAWLVNNWIKYVGALTWLAINGLVFWQTYNYYKLEPKFFYLHEILGAGLCVSRATANVINLNLGMLVLPMCRGLAAFLRGPTWLRISPRTYRILIDHCKNFHIFCGAILTISSVGHFYAHSFNAVNYSNRYNYRYVDINAAWKPGEDPVLIVLHSVPGITGILLLVVLFLMVSSSMQYVRHSLYDVFWYTHRLFIVFYILVFVHAIRGILKGQQNVHEHTPGCIYLNSSEPWAESEPEPEIDAENFACSTEPKFESLGCSSWMWIVGPLTVYVLETVYRYFKSYRSPLVILNTVWYPNDVLELVISKPGFSCRPSQYVLLQCPEVSTWEWHPYTITRCSRPGKKEFSIFIKNLGDWSGRLCNLLREKEYSADFIPLLPTNRFPCRLYMDGPFGSPVEDVLRYKVSICIAGGIGITPFAAILDHLRDLKKSKVKRLYLFWLCRDFSSYLCFADFICDIYSHFWQKNRPDFLDIQLFLTSPDDNDSLNEHTADYAFFTKRVTPGRPNWEAILSSAAASNPRTKMGVFCCGPKSLNKEVEKWCSRVRYSGTTFHFYHESF